jgi:hypothetical protein
MALDTSGELQDLVEQVMSASGAEQDDALIKPNIIHFVSCACCGGKTTLLFMGVVISVYFIRVIVIGI